MSHPSRIVVRSVTILGLLVCGMVTAVFASDEASVVHQVRSHVQGLSSDEFSVRNASETALLKLGGDAIDPLIDSLGQTKSDASQSILAVIERLWLMSPASQADAYEKRLHEKAWEISPHQPGFEAILSRHASLREARALRALRRLNAIIKLDIDELMTSLQYEANGEIPRQRPVTVKQIAIPRSWKGTDDDLWHFHRITVSQQFAIYFVKGSLTPEQGLTIMSRAPAGVVMTERSEVFLGITSTLFTGSGGCLVQDVEPDGSAQAAGIRRDDLITQIDDEPVANFQDLVRILKSKRSFEEFTVTLIRDQYDPRAKAIQLPVIGLPWELKKYDYPPPPPAFEPIWDGLTPQYRGNPDFLIPPAGR